MAPHDIATRALVVAFKATGKPNEEITYLTGIQKRTINDIFARAVKRGFDPCQRPIEIRNEYLEDAPRSGRPSKQSELSAKVNVVLQKDEANEEAWIDEEDEGGSA
ncbi:hypothetical protein KJE20_14198 [Pyrenophora tritici-repentis]|nr:hypothetical protein KJE20_14198 [Pyrenophora tritici-repentis]